MNYINKAQEFIGDSLSKATKLQAVHTNFMTPRVEGIDYPHVSTGDVLQVVNKCSPTMKQIGCATRVWQVS